MLRIHKSSIEFGVACLRLNFQPSAMALRQTRGVVMKNKILFSAVAFCLGAVFANAGEADVIEINSKTVRDAGGFPFQIKKSGSYRLTSNLRVRGNASAIVVTRPSVVINLNGFRVAGANTCAFADGSPPTITCDGPNQGTGIAGAHRIFNGEVRGFRNGIVARRGQALVIERVTVQHNSGPGINPSGEDLQLTNSILSTNGSNGVEGQFGTGTYVVTNNVFEKNGREGLYLGAGVASHNSFYKNIVCGLRSNVGRGAMVDNNYFGENGTGIAGSMGYRSNVFNGNGRDVSGGINLGQNVCGSVLCSP